MQVLVVEDDDAIAEPVGLTAPARRAVAACPSLALQMVDVEGRAVEGRG